MSPPFLNRSKSYTKRLIYHIIYYYILNQKKGKGMASLSFSIKTIFGDSEFLSKAVELLIYVAIATVIVIVLLFIEKRIISKHLLKKKSIKTRYAENLARVIIIGIAAIWVLTSAEATANFGKVLFQGTAILGAVVGLAAQPVIGDLFAGLMLSIHKPFEMGDRVELDNGVSGVIIDITARHVVVRTIDTVDAIIPNGKVNSCIIKNMSHNTKVRSVHFRFNVAYGTDIQLAMNAIRKAVEESEYTLPAWKGKSEYGPVYFIEYADSSLVMATTVYYDPSHPTEIMKSDVNTRVNAAFAEAGIEIPFNYVNVVMKQDDRVD